jgi:hypothetical protein
MRSEQVYWVFTVTVDQMDKFTPLIPKLVAATEKEPGALQFECNIGTTRRRLTSSNATRIRSRIRSGMTTRCVERSWTINPASRLSNTASYPST